MILYDSWFLYKIFILSVMYIENHWNYKHTYKLSMKPEYNKKVKNLLVEDWVVQNFK